jgi:asparagine synthase (glutamine-hydrolysing)
MCGIAGLITAAPKRFDAKLMSAIPNSMGHRGPDASGYLVYSRGDVQMGKEWLGREMQGQVALFHKRLSILDLTEAGWQPMGTPDGRYYVVFNGEIYNYLELQSKLKRLGYQFRSSSDTEVLLAAYAEWGIQAFTYFVGMFAFALLDTYEHKLILARDFFGIKPLYFASNSESFAFASEIKTLLQLPWVSSQVEPGQALQYLINGVTDHCEKTLFADVQQIPPAHYVEIYLDHPGQVSPVRYWNIDLQHRVDISFDEAAAQLQSLFLQSLQLHLRSDVSLGVALSGGIDSSSITMGVRHLLGDDQDLHTFSYIADEKEISEEKWVDKIGVASRSIMHKVSPSASDFVTDLKRLIYIQDVPIRSTSIYAQYCVYRLAHQSGIKVMLDGQGADEMLGGYPFHIAARWASQMRQGQWGAGSQLLGTVSALPRVSTLWTWAEGMAYLLPLNAHDTLRNLVGKGRSPAWLNMQWFDSRMENPALSPYAIKNKEILRYRLHGDFTNNILPHLLRYGDRNSMAFSVESRVPFLTPELVNFLFSLPEEYIIGQDGTSKKVFREAMRGIVPDSILQRKDKMGFNTSETFWLVKMSDWIDDLLKDDFQIPALNFNKIRKEWRVIRENPKLFDYRLWRWCNFIEWTRQFNVTF